ncbi:anoctamin-1, partial [Salmo salar]|uniref:Anoctamin n=1 Tax=Salmo salar TaxID=8030 RepID=A0ABM3E8G3_SALSA
MCVSAGTWSGCRVATAVSESSSIHSDALFDPGPGLDRDISLGSTGPGLGLDRDISLGSTGPGLDRDISLGSTGPGLDRDISLGSTGPGLGRDRDIYLGSTGPGLDRDIYLGSTGPGLDRDISLGSTGPGLGLDIDSLQERTHTRYRMHHQYGSQDKIPGGGVGPAAPQDGQRSCQFFSDGRRKVDYVLVFYQRKQISVRGGDRLHRLSAPPHPPHRLSVVSNGSSPPSGPVGGLGCVAGQRSAGDGEVCVDLGVAVELEANPADGEMVLIREEFEARLLEAGLEMERDTEVRVYGPSFTRLHVPWPVLSREAEFLKIKVPTKKSYDLKQEHGFSASLSEFWRKVNQPFQPNIPQPGHSTTKQLSHCFSRDKLHLFNISSKDTFFDNATRSRIVYEILRRTPCTRTCQSMGITTLIAKGVYDSAFPLHDGDYKVVGRSERNDRQLLHDEWARYGAFYKYQPVDLIRKYFGEKIGLYFAWLGVYTQLLIPASLVGIIVFCYGCYTVDMDVPSLEMCDEQQNFTMCPLCDGVCDYWHLSTACGTARASHLFDNPATVFFAIFMSLWVATFLEHWKRRQISLNHSWDLTGLEEEEDHPRPKYETVLLQKRQMMRNKEKKNDKKKKRKIEPVQREEDVAAGKDRWRQRLLSAMNTGTS